MNKYSEPAVGKCEKCGDQLLSIPGRNHIDSRRIVCPVCVTNNLEDLRAKYEDTVVLSREEIERCSE